MDVVKEVFNDFYRIWNGTKAVGLGGLMKKYQDEPLFGILLSNISLTAGIEINDVMKEAYGIYKDYAIQAPGDAELGGLYEAACAFETKWKNLWCSQLIIAIVAMLDPDREAVVRLCEEKKEEQKEDRRRKKGMEEKRETYQEDDMPDRKEAAA